MQLPADLSFIGSLITAATSPSWIWISSAASGAVAAWFLTTIRQWLIRPKLVVEINDTLGSTVETDTTDDQLRQRYVRLVIRNKGRTLATNCCAFIDYVSRTDNLGTQYIFQTDLIDLGWSLSTDTIKHIPSRGYRLLDVAHTFIRREDLEAKNHSATQFWINGRPVIPKRLVPEIKMNSRYKIHVLVFGDNAASRKFSCQITVGNTVHDLTIERCPDPRPRQRCPLFVF